jgi:hypothetical protein
MQMLATRQNGPGTLANKRRHGFFDPGPRQSLIGSKKRDILLIGNRRLRILSGDARVKVNILRG